MRQIFILISKLLEKYNLYISKSLSFYDNNNKKLKPNLDFVRYKTLELCAAEIYTNSIGGAVAEVGVYKGNFSEKLSILFPDKKLFLFDTFEGFDDRDILTEKAENFSNGKQDFSATNIELVLSKIQNKHNCIVKKGFFPDTAIDVDDKFCFVNLDADLYQPIYEGLRFFYPKLEKGGYIFVHDFNNAEYRGAREAVLKFCREERLGYTPIPDNGGTAIISK